jgi:hypothetical protein
MGVHWVKRGICRASEPDSPMTSLGLGRMGVPAEQVRCAPLWRVASLGASVRAACLARLILDGFKGCRHDGDLPPDVTPSAGSVPKFVAQKPDSVNIRSNFTTDRNSFPRIDQIDEF